SSGLWLGEVPDVLKNLNYLEQILVSRLRHNTNFIKVNATSYRKMVAHCVSWENPMPQLYQALPPSREELQDLLVVFFVGPRKPDITDFVKLPLIVRHDVVMKALDFLVNNHPGYFDCEISQKNLETYKEDEIIQHEGREQEEERQNWEYGTQKIYTDAERCPFVMSGLMGKEYDDMTFEQRKSAAFEWFNNNQAVLAVGH
ncbi:hypothetical protein BDZ89DRAFT_925854, partial [Hymenopellis radicata]